MNRYLLVVVMLALCASTPDRVAAMSETARQAGCVIDCPKCESRPCPQRPCRLMCPGGEIPCGPTMCEAGQVCCNPSCGICTAPDGLCTQQFCEDDSCPQRHDCAPGFHWSNERCGCVADERGGCTVDDDCELFSDYCTGCDCRALAKDDPIPECGLPGVRCFADPCMNKVAKCVEGRCQVRRQCEENVPCLRGYRWSTQTCSCVKDRSPRDRRKHRPHMPHGPHAPR